MIMQVKIPVILSLWLCFVLSGCVAGTELFIGKQVTDAPIVQLEDGAPASGTWQTFDVTINYQYQTDGDIVELAGEGELSQHYQMVYNRVRSLRVYLFLLDADGLVHETIEIPALLTTTEDKFSFNRQFKVSADVKGFSFGYRGLVWERDGRAYFDSLPSNVAR